MSSTEAKAAPTAAPKAQPKGGLVAYLAIDGAIAAAKFYEKAFGAEIAAMHPPDDQGRTMHVHLYINGSSLMLADFYPDLPWNPEGMAEAVRLILADGRFPAIREQLLALHGFDLGAELEAALRDNFGA